MTQALWRVHVERALAAARKLRAGWPMPHLSARDPVAIRALVLVLAVATFFVAGGDRERRVAAAFNWQGVVTPANYRIDAWVAPPPYTQRPPVILPGMRPGEAQRASASDDGAGEFDPGDPRQRCDRARCRLARRRQGR